MRSSVLGVALLALLALVLLHEEVVSAVLMEAEFAAPRTVKPLLRAAMGRGRDAGDLGPAIDGAEPARPDHARVLAAPVSARLPRCPRSSDVP